MKNAILDTPILLMIFNRPKYALQVLESIRTAKPKQLFIASDGPRKNKVEEKAIVEKLRKDILTAIDWDCEVKTLFRDKNLGCCKAVAGAITWFFESVEHGIILEDDCVPNKSFYPFCEQMLNKYKNDTRISMITGTNYLFNKIITEEDYFFSKYYSIWGWATWKRAWNNYDLKIKNWEKYKNNKEITFLFENKAIASNFSHMFDLVSNTDTWDFSWVYTCIFQNTLSITPIKNLVKNIGEEGAHASKNDRSTFTQMPTEEINVKNIKHPKDIFPSAYLNNIQFKTIGFTKFRKTSILFELKYYLQLRFILKPIEKFIKKLFKRIK